MGKKIVLGVVVVMGALVGWNWFSYETYRSETEGYSFVYPKNWDLQGENFGDTRILRLVGDGGGLEVWVIEAEAGVVNVGEYIEEIKRLEKERVEAGGFPVVPGVSQYEYIGGDGGLWAGFERVTSIAAMADDDHSRMYWRIHNGKLYTILVSYPLDSGESLKFEKNLQVIAKSWKQ